MTVSEALRLWPRLPIEAEKAWPGCLSRQRRRPRQHTTAAPFAQGGPFVPWLVHRFQKPQVLWKSLGIQDPGTYSVRYQQTIREKVNHYYIDHTTQHRQRLWETGRQLRWPDQKGPGGPNPKTRVRWELENFGDQAATTFGCLKGLVAQRAS